MCQIVWQTSWKRTGANDHGSFFPYFINTDDNTAEESSNGSLSWTGGGISGVEAVFKWLLKAWNHCALLALVGSAYSSHLSVDDSLVTSRPEFDRAVSLVVSGCSKMDRSIEIAVNTQVWMQSDFARRRVRTRYLIGCQFLADTNARLEDKCVGHTLRRSCRGHQ